MDSSYSLSKRRQNMNTKRIKLLAAAIGLVALSGTAAAAGNVSFDFYLGAPRRFTSHRPRRFTSRRLKSCITGRHRFTTRLRMPCVMDTITAGSMTVTTSAGTTAIKRRPTSGTAIAKSWPANFNRPLVT